MSYKKVVIALTIFISSATVSAGWFDDLLKGGPSSESTSSSSESNAKSSVSDNELTKAFRQALQVGSESVVAQLGKANGFYKDPTAHIPLPDELEKVSGWLEKAGMDNYTNDLEMKLNRAAEQATPQAKALFIDAIKQISFKDIRQIYKGSEDSATRYFQDKMTASLSDAMSPVVSKSLAEVGAIKRYDEIVKDYKSIPLVPDVKADLTKHVVKGALKGIFHYLAKQEAAIRKDSVKQTTDLLKKVFGQ